MRYLIGAARFVLIGLYIVLIVLIVALVFPLAGRNLRGRIVKRCARWGLVVCGLRLTVKGRVPEGSLSETGCTDSGPGWLVCANHVSFFDIFVMDTIMPVRFVAKSEIGAWPVFGFISTSVGTLYIDRSRRRAVLEVAELMAETMRAGQNILFFPESTTGTGPGLLPFYANLFAAGCMAETRVLPVVIRYTQWGKYSAIPSYAHEPLFRVLRRVVMTPGLGVEATVLDPIETLGRTRKDLCLEASRVMSGALGVPDATAQKEAAALEKRAKTAAEP